MTSDYVTWVRRANSRWIVHHGLSVNAAAYLEHMAQVDPERLRASCRNAYLLARERPLEEDPKPWFYGGLFSLATPAEIQRHLASHWLLRMVLSNFEPELAHGAASKDPGEPVSEPTLTKIKAIREAVARLRASEPSQAPSGLQER